MRFISAARLAPATAMIVMMGALAPAVALADCEGIPSPDSVAAVQGRTFVGVFSGSTGASGATIHHWTAEHVYAGSIPVGDFSYDAGACQEAEYTAGIRYLVSSGSDWTAWNTVAYRVESSGRVSLIGFHGAKPSDFPAALRLRTLDAALAALVLPPTDALATRQQQDAGGPLALLFGGILAAFAPIAVLRRRSGVRAVKEGESH